jgi:hypothetical protein
LYDDTVEVTIPHGLDAILFLDLDPLHNNNNRERIERKLY